MLADKIEREKWKNCKYLRQSFLCFVGPLICVFLVSCCASPPKSQSNHGECWGETWNSLRPLSLLFCLQAQLQIPVVSRSPAAPLPASQCANRHLCFGKTFYPLTNIHLKVKFTNLSICCDVVVYIQTITRTTTEDHFWQKSISHLHIEGWMNWWLYG